MFDLFTFQVPLALGLAKTIEYFRQELAKSVVGDKKKNGMDL